MRVSGKTGVKFLQPTNVEIEGVGGLSMKFARALVLLVVVLLASACSYQVGFNPTYLPDEEGELISAGRALLVMSEEEENFVHSGSPSSFTGGGTTLTIPLGYILKSVAEEVFLDRFSSGVAFSNQDSPDSDAAMVLMPSIRRFEFWYNQLRNAGFAVTPQVEIDLYVQILDRAGNEIFGELIESGRVSGDSYVLSGSPAEKVNQTVHRVLYDLLAQALENARSSLSAPS